MKKLILFIISCVFMFAMIFTGCTGEVKPSEESGSNTEQSPTLLSISIRQITSKLNYEYGDILDLSDLVVLASYSDGSEREVDGWTSNPRQWSKLKTSGTVTVTIFYEEKDTSFTITVAQKPSVTSNEYFWGTWVRMDNGEEFEILESSVKQGSNSYDVTAGDSNTLTVSSLGTFEKQSDSVMVCEHIPYFRKGGANLEYSLKLVGFTKSRAAGSVMSGIRGRGMSSKYKGFESDGESDSKGHIKLTAPTANDIQTVEITNGDEVVVVPGLKIINTGDYMGTVALVGKDDYNLKITGTISDNQKDNGYIYGNHTKTYEMVLSITNISDNKCSTSICSVTTDDPNLKMNSDTKLSGFTISTLASGATKTIRLKLSYGEITKPYVDTGINVTIENPLTNQEWTDYIPLRFFKGTIPITIAAKNPEDNNNAALNGFVIYPDGNNQFFAINNNNSRVLFVPTFGIEKPYMLVFSGATVTSTLSDSTEMYYTVEPASLLPKAIITEGDSDELREYITFGGDNHSESKAYDVTNAFESYLSEGEIDYYKITADSDEYYGPGGTVLNSIKYVNDKGETPVTVLAPDGLVLTAKHLPDITCDGYTFLGWYLNNQKISAGNYTIYDNITLTARWELESYSVTYNFNGGTSDVENPSTYTVESKPVTLTTPVRTGYDFGGWFEKEDLTGTALEEIGGGKTGLLSLYAKWIPVTYTITYYLYGGTSDVENPSTYTIETNTITLAQPSKEDYVFGGWFIDSSLTGSKQTTIEKGSTGNKTYYAKWLTKCCINYISEHGIAPEAIAIGKGEKFTALDLLFISEIGWKFKGWYANNTYEENKKASVGQTISTDLTLYAKWEECNGIDDGFVFVEGGTVIGSSNYNQNSRYGPNHIGAFPAGKTVTLSSFYISDHELTQGEYEEFCCYTEATPSSRYGVGEKYAAYYVSYYDAIVYCNLVSMIEGLKPCYSLDGENDPRKWPGINNKEGKFSCSYTDKNNTWNSISWDETANGYRLPTGEEWEYAARGGQETYGTDAFAYSFAGAKTEKPTETSDFYLGSVGWYQDNSLSHTHEIKKKYPNALNLYDMTGNVSEWCWGTNDYRTYRGGNWDYMALFCYIAYRYYAGPGSHDQKIGLRLVRSAQ